MDQPVYETKKDYIARQIKRKILSGEYRPGSRLKVRHLALEFGTSEIPVREAIIQLASSGLVTIRPHAGATATPISSHDLKNIFQVRSALERLATELACQNMTARDLTEVQSKADALKHAVDEGLESDVLNQLNREFHMSIYRCSDNHRLVQMIEELWNHAGRYPAPLTGQDDNTYQSVKEHSEIVSALKDRDGRRAADLAEQHKDRSFERILVQVEQLEQSDGAAPPDESDDEADVDI